MAPYEYRLCAEPHPQFHHAWTVTVWTRHYAEDPDDTGWVCRFRRIVDGDNWPHDPKQCWPLLLGHVKAK